jgi:hypothetical protein
MLHSNSKSKSRGTICVLILLLLLVPSIIYAKGQTTRVSVSSTGVEGNHDSYMSSISSDGRFVVIDSRADNLVDGDNNNSCETTYNLSHAKPQSSQR